MTNTSTRVANAPANVAQAALANSIARIGGLFLAGLQEAADQGRVFRNFHTFTGGHLTARVDCIV